VGASWVRKEILEKYPDARLSVYAIWVPQFGAHRGDVDPSVLDDPRVRTYWDAHGVVANAVVGNPDAYDVYALYDGRAGLSWQTAAATGSTVIGDADRLKGELLGLLS
jgi:hypothetical protein